MSDLQLITARREQVAQLMTQYRKSIAELEAELVELETAGKVMARLMGAKWPPASAAIQQYTQGTFPLETVVAPMTAHQTAMSMPDKLLAVLADANRQGLRAITPKDMGARITEKFGETVKGEHVASIVWRIWKQGRIERVGDGLYRLPIKNEAAGESTLGDPPAASDVNQQVPLSRAPGGGT